MGIGFFWAILIAECLREGVGSYEMPSASQQFGLESADHSLEGQQSHRPFAVCGESSEDFKAEHAAEIVRASDIPAIAIAYSARAVFPVSSRRGLEHGVWVCNVRPFYFSLEPVVASVRVYSGRAARERVQYYGRFLWVQDFCVQDQGKLFAGVAAVHGGLWEQCHDWIRDLAWRRVFDSAHDCD